jgi:ATP-dependent Lon protease
MAAPLVIEPGHYYEVLKNVAKSDHKSMGLFLTKEEDVNIYKVGVKDLYEVGVLARILRIIPMEQGGAQVALKYGKTDHHDKVCQGGQALEGPCKVS